LQLVCPPVAKYEGTSVATTYNLDKFCTPVATSVTSVATTDNVDKFCAAVATSGKHTQKFQILIAIHSFDLSPTKHIVVNFVGYANLVQGVERQIVHHLNPVYHPLELDEKQHR
jgi:hypothetical protein